MSDCHGGRYADGGPIGEGGFGGDYALEATALDQLETLAATGAGSVFAGFGFQHLAVGVFDRQALARSVRQGTPNLSAARVPNGFPRGLTDSGERAIGACRGGGKPPRPPEGRPMNVPLIDLKEQYASLRTELEETLLRVARSQQFILGPEVEALERELAEYCGVAHCVALSSGTDALLAALMALGIGPGDEVLTTPYSFFATAGSIVRVGAKPVFADIDPATFNLDPQRVAAAITPRTRAIMPVHLYGQCAEMTALRKIADKHGLALIEDAAQAIGAEHDGRRAGGLGEIGCFSFFPTKNLGAFGDAGAVTTNDPALNDKLRTLRVHGDAAGKYDHRIVGGNFRIDALQAAILRVKLRHLEAWTESRRRNASYLTRMFGELGLPRRQVETPMEVAGRHVFNQYVVRLERRDQAMAALAAAGVGTRVYYPVPLHLQPCFADLRYRAGDLPHAEAAAQQTLALPVYPEARSAQLRHVAEALGRHYAPVPLRQAA